MLSLTTAVRLGGLLLAGALIWYGWNLRTENESLTRSNTELSVKLELQNAAVDGLRTAAEERAEEYKAKIEEARLLTKKAKGAAAAVYSAELPASASCEAREKLTLDLVNTGRP